MERERTPKEHDGTIPLRRLLERISRVYKSEGKMTKHLETLKGMLLSSQASIIYSTRWTWDEDRFAALSWAIEELGKPRMDEEKLKKIILSLKEKFICTKSFNEN